LSGGAIEYALAVEAELTRCAFCTAATAVVVVGVGVDADAGTFGCVVGTNTSPIAALFALRTDNSLIDRSVAVVIFAVAYLGRGAHFAEASTPIAEDAELFAVFTFAAFSSFGLAIVARFFEGFACAGLVVDDTVAIIVEAVADLGGAVILGRGAFT
jgi:hypothetical protein